MVSLSQGRTAAAQCGLFTHKSVPVIFEPPCMNVLSEQQSDQKQKPHNVQTQITMDIKTGQSLKQTQSEQKNRWPS